MEAALRYLYGLDHAKGSSVAPVVFHAISYLFSDKYKIPDLRKLSHQHFRAAVQQSDASALSECIRAFCEQENAKPLLEATVQYIRDTAPFPLRHDSHHELFKKLLDEFHELSVRLAKKFLLKSNWPRDALLYKYECRGCRGVWRTCTKLDDHVRYKCRLC